MDFIIHEMGTLKKGGCRMDFGKKLRELRKEGNVGQKELAGYLNVSISTISNYENNVHSPDLDTLCKLADFFQVSIDYLMDRTKYRYSLDYLNGKFNDGSDISALINTIVRLESQSQQEIHNFVNYMAQRQSQH